MDQKLKAKWIKALRSGKFKQGDGALYKDGKYCCLGVLHEVITGEAPTAELWNSTTFIQPDAIDFDNDTMNELAWRNDGKYGRKKQGFRGIATYIERKIKCS